MLVLTRKYQEKIRIGQNITITVLRMKGKAVRLGIEAPSDVPVVRGELSFEVELSSDESESTTVEPEPALSLSIPSGRQFAATPTKTSEWSTASNPDAASRSAGKQPTTSTVGFSRVPRDKVANLMPKLVSGTAPLRAMMEQR